MEEKKRKYQVCKREHNQALPVDWDLLPENAIEIIDPLFLYNVMCIRKESGYLGLKTVVYVKPVNKFKKDTVIFNIQDNVEFGI